MNLYIFITEHGNINPKFLEIKTEQILSVASGNILWGARSFICQERWSAG